jgi:hypothetical protein
LWVDASGAVVGPDFTGHSIVVDSSGYLWAVLQQNPPLVLTWSDVSGLPGAGPIITNTWTFSVGDPNYYQDSACHGPAVMIVPRLPRAVFSYQTGPSSSSHGAVKDTAVISGLGTLYYWNGGSCVGPLNPNGGASGTAGYGLVTVGDTTQVTLGLVAPTTAFTGPLHLEYR